MNDTHIKTFNYNGKGFRVILKNMERNPDVVGTLKDMIKRGLDEAAKLANDPDAKFGVELNRSDRKEGTHPFLLDFRRRHDHTDESIDRRMERLTQSSESFKIDNDLQLKIVWVTSDAVKAAEASRPQTGKGGNKNKNKKRKLSKQQKSSILDYMGGRGGVKDPIRAASMSGHGGCLIKVKNYNENLCLARAVSMAKARLDGGRTGKLYGTYRYNSNVGKLFVDASILMREAGLQHHRGPCGRREIRAIESALPNDYQIEVLTSPFLSRVFYPDDPENHPPRGARKVLTLYFWPENTLAPNTPGHYDVVTSVPALFKLKYWCHCCKQSYDNKRRHNCEGICSNCRQPGIFFFYFYFLKFLFF